MKKSKTQMSDKQLDAILKLDHAPEISASFMSRLQNLPLGESALQNTVVPFPVKAKPRSYLSRAAGLAIPLAASLVLGFFIGQYSSQSQTGTLTALLQGFLGGAETTDLLQEIDQYENDILNAFGDAS